MTDGDTAGEGGVPDDAPDSYDDRPADQPLWNEGGDSDDDASERPDEVSESADARPGTSGEPELPDDVDPRDLDVEIRNELRTLNGPVSALVAKRLVASGMLLDDDPEGALAQAMVARRLAPRVASVREAVGLAAYHTGQWQSAIAELRTYHRITGRQTHLAVIADCERALGRPERAVDLYRAANLDKLAPDEAIELLIVAAGARTDLGQVEAAAAMLQVPDLRDDDAPWGARLRYAYADTLHAAGRTDEAREWFARAAQVDNELVTDAAERLLDLDGVVIDDSADHQNEDEFEEEFDGEHEGEDDDRVSDTAASVERSVPAARAAPEPEPKPAGHAVIFAAPVVPDEPDDEPTDPEETPR